MKHTCTCTFMFICTFTSEFSKTETPTAPVVAPA